MIAMALRKYLAASIAMNPRPFIGGTILAVIILVEGLLAHSGYLA
ncbi:MULTISPECIES: hypothetical protein [unclassified Sphingomonas]|nr:MULTISPECIES: hypothetical protein [unclassified Sphingomonas]